MTAAIGALSVNVLLIEPDGLVRSTVASVCRELQIVRMHQATSLAMGKQWLQTWKADGLMLSLADPDAALDLLSRLRAREFQCEAGIPVAVMATACDAAMLKRLKELEVRRFLLQPFKLRDVIQTVEQLWPAEEKIVA
ncbi:MAG: hypothetical protein Q8M80_16160 [Hydrogenophaga sp.]|uniref:hypothetical protein n=1 Tax=Hydrogenophaga sp. TaxID=1904254 RepID=UPI0025C4E106|nr:hypothetical protein [Hydrogenophaga sp.]MDO9135332.1 hypothetical protein [Hydrogenophaga sp.]MDO9506343.1 hypothetical protein [Hydrogenophaga sp.]MDP3205592.1 hypothetical protein [Hydrogenophaga sp.]MDP3627140.1 hypothetical protein [Hydrogenophaga sp.]